MRRNTKRAAALLVAAGITCMAGTPLRVEAAVERPSYWKAATYYSDDWVCNFWNSESYDMEEELRQIAADGFNSIILVVPWKEFQPETQPEQVEKSDYAYEKLERVFREAEKNGLWVFLRVGYTWDYTGEGLDAGRYAKLLYDENTRQMWLDYVRDLYAASSSHENFAGGFLTWEDFWNFLQDTGNGAYEGQAVELAEKIGYQEFLRQNYSLEDLQNGYGLEAKTYEEIGLPLATDPMFYTFYQFYDRVLNQILEESQTVFPGLSMEARLDVDPVPSVSGSLVGASHETTFGCGNADYTAAMYSIYMGQNVEDGDITAETALTAMDKNLSDTLGKNGGKPLFLEQFLYYDNTPEFSYNPKLQEGQYQAFFQGAVPILKEKTGGYGVWTYRNYGNNALYNSQFGLGQEGWEFSGKAYVDTEGNHQAVIPAGSFISQDLGGRAGTVIGKAMTVEFDAESSQGAHVTVSCGGESRTVEINGESQAKIQLVPSGSQLKLYSDGEVTVDNVRFYSWETDGRLYGMDGTERDLIPLIRELNASLP